MDAKEYLKQVERFDVELECKEVEKQQWRDLTVRITANMEGERVQSSGSKSPMADAANNCVDMESEIAEVINKLIEKKKDVTQTIEKVQNPTWYRVLHMIYIRYMDLEEVADKCNKSYDWAKKAHSNGLKIVQKIMDEEKCHHLSPKYPVCHQNPLNVTISSDIV